MGTTDHVEEFAVTLRGLKERSGRSYGALARRLHVSTSTLHRYCNGDAVPAEYAPVERFARQCGATPEELVALHRRWILADGARRSASGRGAQPRPAPVERAEGAEGTSAPSAEPAGEQETKAPAGAAGPMPAEPPAAGQSGSTAPQEPGGGARAGSDPANAARTPEPVPGRLLVMPGARAGRSKPWTLVLGLAAAVVLAVTAAEVRPPDSGTRNEASGSPVVGATTPSAQRTGEPGKEKGKGKSSGKSSESPTPGEKRPRGGASTPAAHDAPGGGTSEHSSNSPKGAPFTLSTRSHVWEEGCGHDYVINRPPSDVPPPPVEQDAATWAASQGAVHGGTTNVEVSVAGRSSTAVVLKALHVRVVGRHAPLAWNSYAMDNGCGGSITPRAFSVNLDAARPLAIPTDGRDVDKPIPAVRFPYRVSSTDPEVLLVNARAVGCDCSWYLELDWSGGGREGTVRIDDNGRPFRTSGIGARPQYQYWTSDHAWTKAE